MTEQELIELLAENRVRLDRMEASQDAREALDTRPLAKVLEFKPRSD